MGVFASTRRAADWRPPLKRLHALLALSALTVAIALPARVEGQGAHPTTVPTPASYRYFPCPSGAPGVYPDSMRIVRRASKVFVIHTGFDVTVKGPLVQALAGDLCLMPATDISMMHCDLDVGIPYRIFFRHRGRRVLEASFDPTGCHALYLGAFPKSGIADPGKTFVLSDGLWALVAEALHVNYFYRLF